jgi:hypothetical protein
MSSRIGRSLVGLAGAAAYAPLFWLLRPFTPATVADASALLRVAVQRAVTRSG